MKTVVYKSVNKLDCACDCATDAIQVIICLPESLTLGATGYIPAEIVSTTLTGQCHSQQVYSYYLQYNESLLADSSYSLKNADITGVICKGCLTDYIESFSNAAACFSCENANICAYPEVYPECYGARGDGVTDDSAAFQQMLIEHPVNTRFAFGYEKTYLLESGLVVPITASNLYFKGNGAQITGANNGPIVQVSDVTTASASARNINFDDMTIEGAGSTDATLTNQDGMYVGAILGLRLNNVRIINIPRHCFVGVKSTALGSAYFNKVALRDCEFRFCGEKTLYIGANDAGDDFGSAADDFKSEGCLYGHGGERLDTGVSEGAAAVNSIVVDMDSDEFSGNYSLTPNAGYLWALQVQTASGHISAPHFEINGYDQAGSADLYLDNATSGLVIEGSNHYGIDAKAAKRCIIDAGKKNTILGVVYGGNPGIHQFDYIVYANNATKPTVGAIQSLNAFSPNIQTVSFPSDNYTTSPILVAHDNYVMTGRRRERFQTRYDSTNPAQIVISGWGDAADVVSCRAYDSHGDFTIRALGAGQTNPATITITFADGAWKDDQGNNSEPTCFMYERTTSGGGTLLIPQVAINATRILFTANSAPVAGTTYTFSWHIIGM